MIEPLAELYSSPRIEFRQCWVIHRDHPAVIDFIEAEPLRCRDGAVEVSIR
jgi:hypothetical protein